VPPDQGLAVRQQTVPGLSDRHGAEDADTGVIALGSTARRFSRCAFQQARSEASGWQRAGRWREKPVTAGVLPGDQGESERIDVVDGADRQAQRECNASADRAAAQGSLRAEGQLRGYRHERCCVSLPETLKDHPAQLAFDGARGERCSDLVERGGGRRS
jgi:hypothetical protein